MNEVIKESYFELKKIGLKIGLKYGVLKSFMNLKIIFIVLFEYGKYMIFI